MSSRNRLTNIVDDSLLPPLARELVLLVGLKDAMKIIGHFGGQRVRFSSEARHQGLQELIGDEKAEKVARHFGVEEFDMPRCQHALRQIRNQHIVQDREHMTDNELARKYGLTRVGIYQILRKAASD